MVKCESEAVNWTFGWILCHFYFRIWHQILWNASFRFGRSFYGNFYMCFGYTIAPTQCTHSPKKSDFIYWMGAFCVSSFTSTIWWLLFTGNRLCNFIVPLAVQQVDGIVQPTAKHLNRKTLRIHERKKVRDRERRQSKRKREKSHHWFGEQCSYCVQNINSIHFSSKRHLFNIVNVCVLSVCFEIIYSLCTGCASFQTTCGIKWMCGVWTFHNVINLIKVQRSSQ